jgi:lipopolysaccharide transport system permease protein
VPARTGDGLPTAEASSRAQHLLVIKPRAGWPTLGIRDLWEYRELLYFLAWRDIKVRYKQTAIGAAWAVLQPVIAMIVFTIIFGKFAKISTGGVPYPIFSYAALLPWNFFSNALQRSITSVVTSSQLVSKVYFPRLVVPLSATLSGTLDFAVAFVVLLGLMVWYGLTPGWGVLALPLLLSFALLAALSVGLWLAALNVKYRDIGHAVPFVLQIWLFASPLVYPVSMIPQRWRVLYGLNPMAGVIEGFRWALLGTEAPAFGVMGASAAVVTLLLLGGVVYFRRTERTFGDVI